MKTLKLEKMENLKKSEIVSALKSDPRVKEWICGNLPLFEKSEENSDLFLTTYRIRNAYEILLNKLNVGEEVKEEKDLILVQRLFDMDFYPPKKLSLSGMVNGVDPRVKIIKAYKAKRNKGNRRRSYEINLELDNGKTYQINPNDVMNKFLNIKRNFENLLNSYL
jgi:hypothetical protein